MHDLTTRTTVATGGAHTIGRPIRTTSGLYPVRLRQDLPREVASAYWAGPHGELLTRLPHLVEYNQYHFSATDHGYWPATHKVGTTIPSPMWTDGVTEVRYAGMARALLLPPRMREIFFDEQNVFEHVLGHQAGPGGGRWWTTGHDDAVGHRTVLFLRRRRGVSSRSFRAFVHDRLGPALHAAGARDLRTYTFVPLSTLLHRSPGVSHDNPPHRRYHGAVILGTGTRADIADIVASPEVAAAVNDQHLTCTAVHAFAVERTVPVIRVSSEGQK